MSMYASLRGALGTHGFAMALSRCDAPESDLW
jgi:hypothetical protein